MRSPFYTSFLTMPNFGIISDSDAQKIVKEVKRLYDEEKVEHPRQEKTVEGRSPRGASKSRRADAIASLPPLVDRKLKNQKEN